MTEAGIGIAHLSLAITQGSALEITNHLLVSPSSQAYKNVGHHLT